MNEVYLKNNNSLIEIQKKIIKDDIILKIYAELASPRIGGYKARPYDSELCLYEPPRASEIKAIWRWWMRAILAGIYNGQKTYDELDREIGYVLGTTERTSYFTVIINTNNELIRRVQERGKIIHKLITEIIPQVLTKFMQEWDKKYFNITETKIVHINFIIPITIRFQLHEEKSFMKFKNILADFKLDLHSREIRGKRKKKCKEYIVSLINSQQILCIINKLGVNNIECLQNMSQNEIKKIVSIYDELVEISKIPRIRILIQPRSNEGENSKLTKETLNNKNKLNSLQQYLQRISEDLVIPIKEKMQVEIIVIKNRELNDNILKFAVSSLFISLIMGGLGSITRRGFGSIQLIDVNINESYKEVLKEESRYLGQILNAETEESLKRIIIEFLMHAITMGKKAFKINNTNHPAMPKVPSVIPNSEYFKIEIIKCKENQNMLDLLKLIGEACLKTTWKKLLGIDIRSSGENLHTWILGLPRSAQNTGYFINSERGRRSSAINIKLFRNKKNQFIIIYGFLSSDWPISNLIHKGKHHPAGKRVKNLNVRTLNREIVEKENDETLLRIVFHSAFQFIIKKIKGG